MKKVLKLTERHIRIMQTKNILVSVYTNASGFLWNMMKVNSGTDLGWCGLNGNCKESGSFKSYGDALEDALNLIDKCDLKQYQKDNKNKEYLHWGNYANHLNKKYR